MNTILLIEDDDYIARVYERMFRVSGHELVRASDGEQAWNQLTTMNPLPSVIVLDLFIPKISGEDLFEDIRKDSRFKHIPVAILTNSFHEEDKKKFLELGASLFMVKIDHTPSEVVKEIESLMGIPDAPQGTP